MLTGSLYQSFSYSQKGIKAANQKKNLAASQMFGSKKGTKKSESRIL